MCVPVLTVSSFFVLFSCIIFSPMVASQKDHPRRPTVGSLPSSRRQAQESTFHVHSTSTWSPESSTMSNLAPIDLSSIQKLSSLARRMPPITVSFCYHGIHTSVSALLFQYLYPLNSYSVRRPWPLHCRQGAH